MKRDYSHSEAIRSRFHRLIPGGSHTYAKGDDQFPEGAAPYLVKGSGCRVWDVDGNEYIEYAMGLRSVTLGHAYPSVNEAAARQMSQGLNFGRPAPIELKCAEEFLGLISGAEMVKFAKNGSDVTTAALKLARAFTGRDMVAVCSEHPFFSSDDWFIGTTAVDAGIPTATKEMTVTFRYNDLESVQKLFDQYPDRIACLFLEPEKQDPPAEGYLKSLKALCHKNGALLVFDEIITGFRWHLGGAQGLYGVVPDLCTFGKALGNGFSISALAGRRDIMRLGGLDHERERVFLLSTTYGAEYHALAAASEVMRIYREEPVIETLYGQGGKLEQGIRKSVSELKLNDYFEIHGRPCCMVYVTKDATGNNSQEFRTLFLQETIDRGLIMPSLVISYSHTDKDIEETVEKIHEALVVYQKALSEGIEKFLRGRPVAPVYRKYNRQRTCV